mmetsp:Transcript_9612/g.15933  ORF Transcript_9612/g.15933 Transcript_9612/m.15933 type:complete len:299 (-) Transcript_9612:137-1033(-)
MHSIKMVLSDLLFLAFPASFPAFLCARDTALQLPPAPPSLAAGTAEESVSVQVSLPGSSLAQGIETGFQFRSNQSINQSIQIFKFPTSNSNPQNSKFKIQNSKIRNSNFRLRHARGSRCCAVPDAAAVHSPRTPLRSRCCLCVSVSLCLLRANRALHWLPRCSTRQTSLLLLPTTKPRKSQSTNQSVSQSVSRSGTSPPSHSRSPRPAQLDALLSACLPACLLRGRWRGRWMEGCAIASGARTPLMMRVNPWISLFAVPSEGTRGSLTGLSPSLLPPDACRAGELTRYLSHQLLLRRQ